MTHERLADLLRALIDYNWDDELEDFQSNGPDSYHIFNTLVELDNYLSVENRSAESYLLEEPPTPGEIPRTISVSWSIEDVQSVRWDLTDEQALEVLEAVKHSHDASIGIHWDVLETYASLLFPRPKN